MHVEDRTVDVVLTRHIANELVHGVHWYSLNIVFGMRCQRGRIFLSSHKRFITSRDVEEEQPGLISKKESLLS